MSIPTRGRIVEVVDPERGTLAAIVTGVREDGTIDTTAFIPGAGGTRDYVSLSTAEQLANAEVKGKPRPVDPATAAHWRWPDRTPTTRNAAPLK